MVTPLVSAVVTIVLLASSMAAIFLAGGTLQGSLGVFLVGSGVAMISCPPRARVDWRLWVAAAGLVGCGALAFLPARWWRLPSWRVALGKESIAPLPVTISTEPWTTAFWLGVLALSVLIGLFLLAHPLRSKWLLRCVFFSVLASGAYAALAIYAKRSGWHYAFEGGATFGFFPNRNHTATFLVVGSVLALAVLTIGIRESRWLLAGLVAVVLSTCLTALFFFSGSRAGVIFVLLGGLIWMAGLGRGHLNLRLLVSFVVLLLAGAVLFLVSESEVRGRLFPTAQPPAQAVKSANPLAPAADRSEAKSPPFDFRVLIYRDTLRLIRDHPLTGTGLGCFNLVFPQYREASLSEAAAIHPESDWLMLVAEAGIPALLCLLGMLVFLGQRLRALRSHPFWPVRWGCVAAAATAILHGLVDVPAHRVELGWWILIIAGLGFQIPPEEKRIAPRFQHLVFVAGGLAAVILGGGLIRAEWLGGEPLPPFKAGESQTAVFKAYQRQDFAGATKLVRQAILDSPMYEPLYFQLGVLLAQTETDDAESDANFKTQRLLNPFLSSIPLQQGEVWMNHDPARTAAFWREALERNERIGRTAGNGKQATLAFYQGLIGRTAENLQLQRALLDLADRDPRMILTWLGSVRPEVAREKFSALAENQDFLRTLDSGERTRFLLRWYAAGDRAALDHWLANQSTWNDASWPVRMRQLVDGGSFEQATREAARHYGISLALLDEKPDDSEPTAEEAKDPIAAFYFYRHTGNTLAARRVLNEDKPELPQPVTAELSRIKAAVAAQENDWPAAWQAIQQHLRSKGVAIDQ